MSDDIVIRALSSPISWERFEALAIAVLALDDLPALRHIGGRADKGIDGISEAFLETERTSPIVVQVTSQRAQDVKLRDTMATLEGFGKKAEHLVLVTNHPTSARVHEKLKAEGKAHGLSLDIRDQSYLATRLSERGSPLFARYFGSESEQVVALFERADPLQSASSEERHALLASLGAFVLSSRAGLVRSELFDKTVLAVVAAKGGRRSRNEILRELQRLLPGEAVDAAQISAAVSALERAGVLHSDGDELVLEDKTLAELTVTAKSIRQGYDRLIAHVVGACKAQGVVDAAAEGYLERNTRRVLLQLFRVVGPIANMGDAQFDVERWESDFLGIMAANVSAVHARAAISAIASFVAEPGNKAMLAPFVRAYSAVAIRNLDPLGRSWQSAVLSRSVIALDTDALLYVLVESLPEHEPLIKALGALAEAGVRLEVAEHVLDEAEGHLGRSGPTFRRFEGSLLRLPPSVVDEEVWHAVARGYYYAVQKGYKGSPADYVAKYVDTRKPREYLKHLLAQRLPGLRVVSMESAPEGAEKSAEGLTDAVLKLKERTRWKAGFRDADEMAARVSADVCMALHLTRLSGAEVSARARGYLISSDTAYAKMEKTKEWEGRPEIHIATRAVPQLAAFVCGTKLSDDDVVGLLFEPVVAVAAGQVAEEIVALAKVGVELQNVSLERLEWDLAHDLRGVLERMAHPEEGTRAGTEVAGAAERTIELVSAAERRGYGVIGPVKEMISQLGKAHSSLEEEREKRREAQDKLSALVESLSGGTKKSRRRMHRVLRELGIAIETPEPEDAAGEE